MAMETSIERTNLDRPARACLPLAIALPERLKG